ncbi:MAG TPA: YggS family pyridoxal phosphate-dependent enzyme [Marmoricola sp.]|jgi:pyridoxal phosphate enzyme (YggS family)|nr:YggS family pyridoxal phosphate-dependent enzyme [Marmoricola sp.]
MSEQRREQLRDNLDTVRQRIAAAAGEAGRAPDDVQLVVVTKFFPASDVRLLAGLGVTDVGENRHQEAQAKAAECADLPLCWHFVGGLQSNKAAAVASYADVVESVDRTKLVGPLQRGAHERGRDLDVLVQVSLDPPGAGHRNGADPAEVPDLVEAIQQAGSLRLRGVMAVAPLGEDPTAAFERLARVAESVRAQEPAASWISAGMSGDLEQAVKCGATHVRIGSAVLGPRPRVK